MKPERIDVKKLKREGAFEEKAVFSFAVHMDRDGALADGEILFTPTRLILWMDEDDQPDLIVPLSQIRSAAYRPYTGSCCVEIEGEDGWRVFCRSTASDKQNLSQLARILKEVADGALAPEQASFTEKRTVCPTCLRPLPPGSDVCPRCTNKKGTPRRLWQLMKPSLKWILLSMALFGVTTALNLVLPRIQQILVDRFIKTEDPSEALKHISTMVTIILTMVGIRVADTLFTSLRGLVLVRVANRVLVKMRQMIYHRIHQLSVAEVSSRTAGELINRVSRDTSTVATALSREFPHLLEEILIIGTISVILFATSWKLALFILLPVPLVVLMFRIIWRKTHLLYHRQWVENANVNTVLYDIFQGVRVVKVYGTEKREVEKFDAAARITRDISYRNEKAWAKMMPFSGFVLKIGSFILLYFVGNQILQGNMTLGQLTMFTSYVSLIYAPVRWISHFPRIFQRFVTASSKVFEIIDEEPDVKDKPDALSFPMKGQVDIKHVYFGYDESENVLEDVSVSVSPGEMLGIVGRSGVGKSTLMNLVMRLYDVERGSIEIDGVDVRDISQHSLRSQIGVVLQESFLFSGTIFDNIAYAKPDATLDEVVSAARKAAAHSFIMKLPDGYNTYVGERGYTLSGGERQRLAIARAILHDPRILLLDEATSSLDTETEREVQEALKNLCRDRTTIAIAHRLSTLRNATKLLVLDKKRVAEIGTHEELMEKGGIYHSLVLAQRDLGRVKKTDEETDE